ncbi:tetratricopeptide repeat protein [Myxococcota bacterium]|nr:tetratricopeptide repeat protein [Myxococcota bacterium]MBU1430994.1 tetratricopeptide repeat protein [Myxococcota bacterium]MBU1900529.1 tetratricopeptide repeat protein [Myxococcota bacterium]
MRFARAGLWSVALALLIVSASHAAQVQLIQRIHQQISDWAVVPARAALTPLLAAAPEDPSLTYLQARLLFFEGRYAEALAAFDRLIRALGDAAPTEILETRRLVEATHAQLKGFDEQASPDGRFLIRYSGRDALLLPYILDVLQAADTAFAADFGGRSEGQILVEIYPRAEVLAAVSPLTAQDIETSGTIALCKYNRLMFTSPRGTARGYDWRDTVAHEFAHYYINKHAGNTNIPIWLHEGLAKLQETRWRAAPGFYIEPPQEDLLARSLEIDKLITFEQMHPSLAKLPSQEAASLAYAQVHTVLFMLYERGGYPKLMALLKALSGGASMDKALLKAYGVNLDGLWRLWRGEIQKKGLKSYPGLKQMTLKFKRPGDKEGDEPEGDFTTIEDKMVKDLAHIGELLRARGRHLAALKEYRKASARGGDGHPIVQNGQAAALLALGRPEAVAPLLSKVALYYPSLITTHLHLAESHLRLGQREEATAAFERALGINPFDPRPHLALMDLYEATGQAAGAERSKRALEFLK